MIIFLAAVYLLAIYLLLIFVPKLIKFTSPSRSGLSRFSGLQD